MNATDEVEEACIKLAAEMTATVTQRDVGPLRQVLPENVHLTAVVITIALRHNDDGSISKLCSSISFDTEHGRDNIAEVLLTTGFEVAADAHDVSMYCKASTGPDGKLKMSEPYTMPKEDRR